LARGLAVFRCAVIKGEWRITSMPSTRTVFFTALALSATFAGRAHAQSWSGYGRDPQHSAASSAPTQIPRMVRWKTPVDDHPQLSGGADLLIHYGSPLITRSNTVLVTVKTGNFDFFRIDAIQGGTGHLLWSMNTDYSVPTEGNVWVPSCGSTLTPRDQKLVVPGAGGTVITRTFPDQANGLTARLAFFDTVGNSFYANNPTGFNNTIKICTPITSDGLGNVYFGFVATGVPPVPLNGFTAGRGGIARISNTGVGSWVSAAVASGDANIRKLAFNCAPALSIAGDSVYFAVNSGDFTNGYLVQLNSLNLSTRATVRLMDPRTDRNLPAAIPDSGSASPTVGPDGDVYFGVLEANFPSHNDRGWLLHYSGDLSVTKTPGSFGWDDTASVVPASAVPSYNGTSSYLLLTKYNNYAGINSGNGVNKVAILDPHPTVPMNDPVSGATAKVMTEVLTVTGVTPDAEHANFPNAVREWCINIAAVDASNKCAIINSEDGTVYRWNFVTNSLDASVFLNAPIGEAYTPTVVGPDGAVYAVNDAWLYSCVTGQVSGTSGGGGGVGVASAKKPATSRPKPMPRNLPASGHSRGRASN
jgi:hypothetical protein